ncbi:hypothetical protein ACFX13_018625 [Malus domestica]
MEDAEGSGVRVRVRVQRTNLEIVGWHVKEGANYHRGLVSAKGHVGVVVTSAIVFLQALLPTMSHVLAILTSKPTMTPANALNTLVSNA